MAVDAVEATKSLPKEAGLVGLDGPLDELDLTKMLVENFEDNGPEETSPSGDAVEEAERLRNRPRKHCEHCRQCARRSTVLPAPTVRGCGRPTS